MTRLSQLLLPTEREPPADAEAVSHKLMVRAGLVRQIGTGLWSWLPAGWRLHQNVVQIIREEINAIGGQEMLMPVLQPADPWRKTGRYDIDELFKLKDRKGADMVLAMTHEECITTHVAQVVRSYRDLPFSVYHFQVKERDEPRPRAGVLRTREFIMKDAYTFDRDEAGLQAAYDAYAGAYERIFARTGLEWYSVESDVGMMGGSGAHEYMAPCSAGENEVALAPGYAANVEVASAEPQAVDLPDPMPAPESVHTPGATTVAAVSGLLDVPAGGLLKSLPIVIDDERGFVVLVVRGDHRVNEIKLTNALGAPWRAASEDEIAERLGPPGFIGPVGADATVLLDDGVDAERGYVAGANEGDHHLRGVKPGRDFEFERVDCRTVEAGDTVGGHSITIEPAIEVGNIFQLGTRYSEPLGATFLDEDGVARPIVMGSYGIGPARIVAAAVEQFADDKGISWPRALAPWDVEIVALGKPGSDELAAAEGLYRDLQAIGLDVLLDDRHAGPGAKFADAELLGVPLRLTVGRRSLESGRAEAQQRRGLKDIEGGIPLEGAAEAVVELWRTLP
ncbi:MAG TPA: proline--tRNA ligase [Solirubrobacteraceae bacterium]|nr:proline--tRNA ligase [Solirubrobacteraceae bacterium]